MGSTPSPGPAGRAILPERAGSGSARSANIDSVARPHGASGPRDASAAAACTAPATPSGPSRVEAEIDLRARAAHERGGCQQARDATAAGDLQAHGVGRPGGERAVLGRGLVDRHTHRHALAHLAHRSDPVRRLLDQLEPGGGERVDRRDRLARRSMRRWRPAAAPSAGRPPPAPPPRARHRRPPPP